jgi:hypothetical protein
MTKKRYPKTARVSRSAQGRRSPGRLPQPVDTEERPLTRNAFRNLDPSVGDNPVAAMVHRMPDVRAARGHLARAAKRLRERPQDRARFIAYDDAWTAYCVLCEERYFNLGFEHGTRAGIGMAMGNIATNAAVMRSIARAVHAAVLAPVAPRQVIAAGLIELARALILPTPETQRKGATMIDTPSASASSWPRTSASAPVVPHGPQRFSTATSWEAHREHDIRRHV